jgi:hypothetical protein
MFTITSVAPTRRLTRVEFVVAELGGSFTADQKRIIERLIDAITAAIEGWCEVKSFAREAFYETLKGYGELTVNVERRPIVALGTVTIDSNVVTDVTIENADEGELYRKAGFGWTAQHGFSLTGGQTWPAFGQPMAGMEEPLIGVEGTGGLIMPEQFLLDVDTVSVVAADKSFNDSAGRFPKLLKAGDLVLTSGFTDPANNGRFIVAASPAPTPSKICVTDTLVNEAAGSPRTVKFDAPAHCRSIDGLIRAANIAVKAAYLTNADDPEVIERQVGQLRTRKSEGFNVDPLLPLQGEAIGYLRPWKRAE